MTDRFWPTQLVPTGMNWGFDDFTAADPSAVTGSIQTTSLYGTRRWHVRMDFDVIQESDGSLAIFEAIVAGGRKDRFWFGDVTRKFRGVFSAPELFANNTFVSGTAGWSTTGGSVDDRIMRLPITFDGASFSNLLAMSAALTVTQNAPYILRMFVLQGSGSCTYRLLADHGDFSGEYGIGATQTGYGLKSLAIVPFSTTLNGYLQQTTVTGGTPGDFFSVPYASLSRGMLVDNGANATTFSAQIDNAAWTKSNTTVNANFGTSPDGSNVADGVIETTANSSHTVSISATKAASVQDWEFHGYVHGGLTRTKVWIELDDGAGANVGYFEVDLGTGAVGNLLNTGTFTNARAVTVSAGNNWWYFSIVVRTSTGTTVRGVVGSYNAGTTFVGNASDGFYLYGAGLAQSSVAVRSTVVTSAVPSGVGQTGAAIYAKGLPVSIANLGRKGDFAEIILPAYSQLVRLTAPLNSDAAGLGYMQFEPALLDSPPDNAAIIFCKPMGRFILVAANQGVEKSPGIFGKASLEFIEA